MSLPRKRPTWTIRCRLTGNPEEKDPGAVRLSFKTLDLNQFLPPEGRVTQFLVQTMLGPDFHKITPGIYATPYACCGIFPEQRYLSLQAYAETWEPLKELVFKSISSAGRMSQLAFEPGMPLSELVATWSHAMLRIVHGQ